MKNNIINAINNKQVIKFEYDDMERIVEPHTIGCNFKGNDVLRAFQIGGESSTGLNSFKLYSVSKITNLETQEAFSEARNGYTKNDSAMEVIYAEL
jgi:predicted DNA-binding transcriptional regulator YafY